MKPGVGHYAPQVLRRIFLDPGQEVAAYLSAIQSVLKTAAERAFRAFYPYQPASRNPDVLHEYLTALGFMFPENDAARTLRFFDGHREYLPMRGTAEGLKRLAWMATGQVPTVSTHRTVPTPIRLGKTRIGAGTRLHDAQVVYVRLEFPDPLKPTDETLLRSLLEGDRPVHTKYIVCTDPHHAPKIGH